MYSKTSDISSLNVMSGSSFEIVTALFWEDVLAQV